MTEHLTTASNRYDADAPTADPSADGQPAGISWGELSFDQPDGFGTVWEPEFPSRDVDDDPGYGFGV